jgi:hypothetical protein
MNTNAEILKKVNLCERIELNSNTTSKALLLPLIALFLVGTSSLIFLYSKMGVGSIFLLVASLFVIGMILYTRRILKKTARAYIKGDTLVVNFTYGNTPKVMNLKSVRSVKTRTMIGYTYTQLNFKMDGVSYNVVLFGKPQTRESAENIIGIAKQLAA